MIRGYGQAIDSTIMSFEGFETSSCCQFPALDLNEDDAQHMTSALRGDVTVIIDFTYGDMNIRLFVMLKGNMPETKIEMDSVRFMLTP